MLRLALVAIWLSGLPAAAEIVLPRADAIFAEHDPAQVALGQLLFYDPILSGNRNVACATCHHPRFGTSDGVSLGLGDGGIGLGPERRSDRENEPEQRIPRNAQALFNLGAVEFRRFFHDGRLEEDASKPNGIRTPLGEDMTLGFASVLSAQSMFPVLSPDEMAGHYSENDVAQAVRRGVLTGPGGAWDIIAQRVAAITDYRERFDALKGRDTEISFVDISDAIAAFIEAEWRADDSPFDRFLRDGSPLPPLAMDGMALFYGKSDCSNCHAGQFQTDHEFHAIAMPQIGPGKAARFESHAQDLGRMRVTGQAGDAYAFRTPSLRHVTRTAPYGHSGAYASLEAVIRHHLDPEAALRRYDLDEARLPFLDGAVDDRVLVNPSETNAIANASRLAPKSLTDAEIDALIAFLETLTDPTAERGRLGVPRAVPSGLPVDQ